MVKVKVLQYFTIQIDFERYLRTTEKIANVRTQEFMKELRFLLVLREIYRNFIKSFPQFSASLHDIFV